MPSQTKKLKVTVLSNFITGDLFSVEEKESHLAVSAPKLHFNEKLASKFRALASKLQESIDYDSNPATANQNVTFRRSRIISSMRDRADNNSIIPDYLLALATAWDNNDIPIELQKIDSKAFIERFLQYDELPLAHILVDTVRSLYVIDQKFLQGRSSLGLDMIFKKSVNQDRYYILDFQGIKIIDSLCSQLYSVYKIKNENDSFLSEYDLTIYGLQHHMIEFNKDFRSFEKLGIVSTVD